LKKFKKKKIMKKLFHKVNRYFLKAALLFGVNQVNQAQTFNFSGGVQFYTVPPLVTVINVTVAGARGGGNYGSGAIYTSTLAVTPGQVLGLYVGGTGNTGAGVIGGYPNGGNTGGPGWGNEGSGGGSSDIRVTPFLYPDRIIVAGGGGGGGGQSGGVGGAGGLIGVTGGMGQGTPGTGGTSGNAGGGGGSNGGCPSGVAGSGPFGGNGSTCAYGGGGGGGGYYGGGGGGGDNNPCCLDGAGGGGGSSYCLYPGGNCTTGINTGNGYVIICDNLPAPAPNNSTPIANQTLCAGKNGTLTASGSGVISWFSSPSGGSSLGSGTSFVTPILSAGNYTYYAEASQCLPSLSRTPITLTVSANPIITATSGSICTGNSFTIVANGANTYTFQGGGSVKTPTTTTSYTVIGTSANGCVSANTATSNVTVNTTPTVSSNSGTICSGNSFTIIPSGASTYTIQGGLTTVSPLANINYTVSGTAANGCVSANTATSNITVNSSPTVSSNSGTICSGNSFTIIPSGASTYTIQGGLAAVSPLANTSYTVNGTAANGCISVNTATSNVTVNTTPTVAVNSGAICAGNSFTITPSGASTYTVSAGLSVVTPTSNTNYNVTGTSAQGCVGSNTAISSVTVNALPSVNATSNASLICVGQSASLTASGATSYTWNTSATTTVIAISPTVTTSYTVNGTGANGCSNVTTLTQNVSTCAGIQSLNFNSQSLISVYPNPSNGIFNITTENSASFEIADVLGKVIVSDKLNTGNNQLNLSTTPNGIYFLKINFDGKSKIIKLIKE
jgi:hypothetical protein